MSANTAAGALSRFLSSSPQASTTGALMERLAWVLREHGDAGLDLPKALESSGLSRSDFLTVLAEGRSTGVIETYEDAGGPRLRLGPMGKSLF